MRRWRPHRAWFGHGVSYVIHYIDICVWMGERRLTPSVDFLPTGVPCVIKVNIGRSHSGGDGVEGGESRKVQTTVHT